jgi:hypothetical protein
VRSPRPLLQLETFLDQKALGRRNREESKGLSGQAAAQPPQQQQDEMPEMWNNHGVLLRIEQAFGLALDLEDIDLLIANGSIEPQAGYCCTHLKPFMPLFV